MADGDGAFIVYSPQARDPEPRRATGLLGSLRASFDASSDDDSEAQASKSVKVTNAQMLAVVMETWTASVPFLSSPFST